MGKRMASVAGTNSDPLLQILKANGIDPNQIVEYETGDGARKPTGRRTALEHLEAYIGMALDGIEGTEEGQKN